MNKSVMRVLAGLVLAVLVVSVAWAHPESCDTTTQKSDGMLPWSDRQITRYYDWAMNYWSVGWGLTPEEADSLVRHIIGPDWSKRLDDAARLDKAKADIDTLKSSAD